MAARCPSFPKTPPSSAVSSAPAVPGVPVRRPNRPGYRTWNSVSHALLEDVKQHLRPNLPVSLVAYLKDTAYTAIREWDRIARRLEEMAPRDL
jgi:hypothetical protein